ncbi:MAG: bacterial transcriptional activator domain-containing protein [Desulfatibacillaceae bacterium]
MAGERGVLDLPEASPAVREFTCAAVLILAVLLAVYANGFSATWHLDDFHNITKNPAIAPGQGFTDTLSRAIRGAPGAPGGFHRPLSYVSFSLNRWLHGDAVFGFHVVNFLIHFATALLVYLLVRESMLAPGRSGRHGRHAGTVALAAAALWAVHPLLEDRPDDAARLARAALANARGRRWACYVHAEVETARGDAEAAVKWYERHLERRPFDAAARLGLLEAQWGAGRRGEATKNALEICALARMHDGGVEKMDRLVQATSPLWDEARVNRVMGLLGRTLGLYGAQLEAKKDKTPGTAH